MKFCKNCGYELESKMNHCPNCGMNLKTDTMNKETNSGNIKSRIAAGMLGIFLGNLGIHNFYLGYHGKAVGQLLLTILSCGVLSFVSGIWGLVEGIMILIGNINVDGEGNPLGE